MATDLEKSLLDVERKHNISSEQADWETRQPPTEIQIHDDCNYASIPISVIEEKWGFVPSAAHMTESNEMHNCLRDLAHIITNTRKIPSVEDWDSVAVDEDSVLIFW